MKIKSILSIILASGLVFTSTACSGCSDKGGESAASIIETSAASGETSAANAGQSSDTSSENSAAAGQPVDYASQTAPEVEERTPQNAEDSRVEITEEFKITSEDGGKYEISGSTCTISKGGEYTLTGAFSGNIVINAEGEEVKLNLSGCSITSDSAAPIACLSADKLSITAVSDTFNEILDERQAKTEDTEEEVTPENAGAAIYSDCDLNLKGHGALVVTGSYNNGIYTKDDLKIKNMILKVTGFNNALKGKDSVEIESGEIIAIAASGDGIKTENTEVSDKGNQKGSIIITDTVINIYAGRDGISAAYNAELSGNGYVGIYTDTYSNYSEEGAVKSAGTLYLIMSTSDYQEGQDYYGYFSNTDSEEGVYVKSSSVISVYSGRTMYYGIVLEMPSGYDHVAFASYTSGTEAAADNYINASENQNINASQNAFLVSSLSGSSMSGDWVSLSTDSSGKSGKEYSTKGIKASNAITIDGEMTIIIASTDDAIHVNSTDTLENGESSIGTFTMNGGTVKLTTKDDGVHADEVLNMNGGTLIITESYEGLEANQININGGSSFIYASDDAVNAANGVRSTNATAVNVNGGYLEVQTPTGDTDAIDSNGSYIQNGGFVLVKGGSTMGSVAGSVDVDGSIIVNGGCIIACGGVCEAPSGNANAYVKSGTALSSGGYEVKDGSGTIIASFTLDSSYSGFWMACDGLKEDAAYTLSNGSSTILEWTQEAGTMGSGNSFGGPGGFGGPGKR